MSLETYPNQRGGGYGTSETNEAILQPPWLLAVVSMAKPGLIQRVYPHAGVVNPQL